MIKNFQLMEFKVEGETNLQGVQTTLHYTLDDIASPAGVDPVASVDWTLRALRQRWRAYILPRLHQWYRVDRYILTVIGGAQLLTKLVGETIVPTSVRMVSVGQLRLQGTSADRGQWTTGHALPSYVTASFTKTPSSAAVLGNGDGIVSPAPAGTPLIKGGKMGISGILEADTKQDQGNEFTDNARVGWQTAANALLRWRDQTSYEGHAAPTSGGTFTGTVGANFQLRGLSEYVDGGVRVIGVGEDMVPDVKVARISSFEMLPHVGSELKRKQRRRFQ